MGISDLPRGPCGSQGPRLQGFDCSAEHLPECPSSGGHEHPPLGPAPSECPEPFLGSAPSAPWGRWGPKFPTTPARLSVFLTEPRPIARARRVSQKFSSPFFEPLFYPLRPFPAVPATWQSLAAVAHGCPPTRRQRSLLPRLTPRAPSRLLPGVSALPTRCSCLSLASTRDRTEKIRACSDVVMTTAAIS